MTALALTGTRGPEGARAVAPVPRRRRAQLQLGNLLTDRGEYVSGANALQDAFVATRSQSAMMKRRRAHGDPDGPHARRQPGASTEEGHRWACLAEALIGRVRQKDEFLEDLLAHKLSMLLQDEGKYA